jgi:hypothetical protein
LPSSTASSWQDKEIDMTEKPHFISLDQGSHPETSKAIGSLRGGIVGAAERNELPDRFLVESHPHIPAMIIHDLETGRSTQVALFAYGPVREMLNDLFGPAPCAEERFAERRLPLQVEFGAIIAHAQFSQYEKGLAYRLEIEGVNAGDYGVGRIELRDDEKLHVLDVEWNYIGAFGDLQSALEAADYAISPGYESSNPSL